MKKKLLLIGFLVLILIFVSPKKKNQACFNSNCFIVELVKTDEEKKQGLMFKEKLDPNKGMLFIFEKEDKYSFWMKNVLISLDIIWINKNKEVIFISKNNQPCYSDYCASINPNKKAKYVLELNGGIADKINLKIGDKITFNNFQDYRDFD